MQETGYWSGWDGVDTAAVTLVGPIAYFTRISWKVLHFGKLLPDYPINRLGDEKVKILSLLSWIAATQNFSVLRTQNIRNAFPGAPIP
jgi:hypothetical protein